jgi:hypothetical protein
MVGGKKIPRLTPETSEVGSVAERSPSSYFRESAGGFATLLGKGVSE